MNKDSLFARKHNALDIEVKGLDDLAFIAGAFDHFELEQLIDLKLGKFDADSNIGAGAIVKALVCQILNVPHQSITTTSQYFRNTPIDILLGDKGITCEALSNANIIKALDAIHNYGCERLFQQCSAMVASKLNIKLRSAHIDSASLLYEELQDEDKSEDDGSAVCALLGSNKCQNLDLKQIYTVMLCDGVTKIPLIQKAVSENVKGHKECYELICEQLPLLRQQFKDLRYFSGDGALCSGKIIAAARMHNFDIVTRVSEKLVFIKDLYESVKLSEMESINCDDPKALILGKWCGTQEIDGYKVKLLLVSNQASRSKKLATVQKQAEKELNTAISSLKEMSEHTYSSKTEANKALASLEKKLKYCRLSEITYTKVEKDPSCAGLKEGGNKRLEGYKVTANVSIACDLVEKALLKAVSFVIATTDLQRDWSMAQLLGIYREQNFIGSGWKMIQTKKFIVDTLYLEQPSRIQSFMWLMSLAQLLYAATEYEVRRVMDQNLLTIPSVDKNQGEDQPTLMRLLRYMAYCHCSVVLVRKQDLISITNITPELEQILNALGSDWGKYFLEDTYSCMLEKSVNSMPSCK